jgi:hypothetical protein
MKASVLELMSAARKAPFRTPDFTPLGGGPVPTLSTLSAEGKAMIATWKPLLEAAGISDGSMGIGSDPYRKAFAIQNELLVAQMLTNVSHIRNSTLQKEATLVSGSDVPSYARQMIAMILRAFPQMFATQLFAVTPFSGPDGRIYFRTSKYNSALAASGSNPAVADGDGMHDLTKFNKLYAQRDELQAARKTKLSITSMTASVESYRVTSEWSYEAEDDFSALYGGDLGSALVQQNAMLLAWTTDRVLISAAGDTANTTQEWEAEPTGYAALAPSEKKAHQETLWTDGILPLITAMQLKRSFTTTPTWCVCGATFSERLQKLTTFVPHVNAAGDAMTFSVGGLREVGTLRQLGIRVIVDPMMSADMALFGSKPMSSFDPAIHYCPYQPIRATGVLELPNTGQYEKGVYSRFAVVQKDTGSQADSEQLGDPYGILEVI